MSKVAIIFSMWGIILQSLSSNPVNAQSRIDSLQSMKHLIQRDNTISTPGTGFIPSPSKYWYAFAFMLHLSTSEELEEMTKDANPAVRIFSYAGLVYNKSPKVKTIRKRIHDDKASVFTSFGCISFKPIDVANGAKEFIKICDANRKDIHDLLSLLKNNEVYRRQLYDDLVNERPFKNWRLESGE